MPEKMCKKKHLTSFQLIILGFAGVILLGSILLMLPVSSLDKVPTPFHEALFTATSAVCMVLLCMRDTFYSHFGSMRYRACSKGQRKLLVCVRTDGYSCAYTNRWTWSSNRSGSGFASFREKNISHAKKYNAGCNFST